jgi:hypothetical protein
MKECLLKNNLMSEQKKEDNTGGGTYSPAQQKLRKTVQRISIINSFKRAEKNKLKDNARKSLLVTRGEGENGTGGGGVEGSEVRDEELWQRLAIQLLHIPLELI